MSYPHSERVGAFIIRKSAEGFYELLLFHHVGMEGVPIQIPGGGIEPGEALEDALHREIYEESGLENLSIIRKLGALERCWLDTGRTTCRHYFLLESPTTTPDQWEYVVHGSGMDAGLRFSYAWYRPPIQFALKDSCRLFLTPQYIPELYR